MRVATSDSAAEALRIVDVEPAKLGRNEVRVAVHAASVNPVDWKMRAGEFPLGLLQRLFGPRGSFVSGIDFAGVISEVGLGVSGYSVGSRVVGGTNFARGQRGSYAEEVVVNVDQVTSVPDNVSLDDAACLPVAAVTAWMALREHHKIGDGHKVLVFGASGGVGLFALQLSKFWGAKAYGVCSTPNVALVESFGATAIDYKSIDALVQASSLGPFDLIINAVGTETYGLRASMRLLTRGGVLDLVMVRGADFPALVLSALKRLFVRTAPVVRTLLGQPTGMRLAPIVDALARGAVKPLIAKRFALADAEAAHQLSRGGKVVGKLLLQVIRQVK